MGSVSGVPRRLLSLRIERDWADLGRATVHFSLRSSPTKPLNLLATVKARHLNDDFSPLSGGGDLKGVMICAKRPRKAWAAPSVERSNRWV
jgi:hypothetical protein